MTDLGNGPEGEASAAAGPNQNPYRRRRHETKFNKTPWSAYFFYFGPEVTALDGSLSRPFDRYYYASHHSRIQRKHLKKLITQLALNARLKGTPDQNPLPHPDPTAMSEWKRKSYLIAVVDDPAYSFTRDAAITLEPKNGGTGNHTFFDAKDFYDIELPVPGGTGYQNVSAVCVLNHMKKANEEDLLEGDEEEFLFTFHPNLLALRDPDPDDGGKNLGPPVPPP